MHQEQLTSQYKNNCPTGKMGQYLHTGLNNDQVTALSKAGERNIPFNTPTKSIATIIRSNVFTLFNLLNFALAMVIISTAIFFQQPRLLLNLAFMGIITCNTLIGIIQEIRSKRTIDKLSILIEPTVNVLRNGQETTIHPQDIVRGDLMIIKAGNQICVDGTIIQAQNLKVNESLLTGEANQIEKSVGETVFSGSFAVTGLGYIRVDKISQEIYVAQLTAAVHKAPKQNSQIMLALNKIIKVLSITIIPLGILLLASKIFNLNHSINWPRLIVSTVAALVGMIPEGLLLMTSLAFAVGVINLGKKKVLLQTLPAIETLARVDVLCLDKTGTITTGAMQWLEVWSAKHHKPFSPQEYLKLCPHLNALINNSIDTNATIKALEKFSTPSNIQATKFFSFNSEQKWSGAIFNRQLYVIGAPEVICPNLGTIEPEMAVKLALYAQKGLRVLLFAEATSNLMTATFAQTELAPIQELSAKPLALLILADELRADVATTLEYFSKQKVDIKIISGDNAQTVIALCQRIGLNNHQCLDFSQINEPIDFKQISRKYNIFARVKPEQKAKILQSLQELGHTVAMTGDGINDVLALKTADCGIAMAAGSEACRVSADLVLLDNNLAAFIPAVYEGRRIINNIERVAKLFLVKTVYSALMAFLFVFIPHEFPIYPIQITLISSLTIGIPSFVLAIRPNRQLISGQFLTKIITSALPNGLACTIMLLLVTLSSYWLKFSPEQTSALATITLLSGGFLALWQVCQPWDKLKQALYSACLLIFCLEMIFMADIFLISPLYHGFTVALLPLLILYIPLSKLLTAIFTKIYHKP